MEFDFAHYGEERERIATEGELAIYNKLIEMSGRDLKLIRRSDDYVTAVLGEWDIARFKYSPRAKWVMFPCVPKAPKNYISSPEEVENYADEMWMCIDRADMYGDK